MMRCYSCEVTIGIVHPKKQTSPEKEGGESEIEGDWLWWWGNMRTYGRFASTTLCFFKILFLYLSFFLILRRKQNSTKPLSLVPSLIPSLSLFDDRVENSC